MLAQVSQLAQSRDLQNSSLKKIEIGFQPAGSCVWERKHCCTDITEHGAPDLLQGVERASLQLHGSPTPPGGLYAHDEELWRSLDGRTLAAGAAAEKHLQVR